MAKTSAPVCGCGRRGAVASEEEDAQGAPDGGGADVVTDVGGEEATDESRGSCAARQPSMRWGESPRLPCTDCRLRHQPRTIPRSIASTMGLNSRSPVPGRRSARHDGQCRRPGDVRHEVVSESCPGGRRDLLHGDLESSTLDGDEIDVSEQGAEQLPKQCVLRRIQGPAGWGSRTPPRPPCAAHHWREERVVAQYAQTMSVTAYHPRPHAVMEIDGRVLAQPFIRRVWIAPEPHH